MRFGVCIVPFEAAFDHPWLQPKPTAAKSWDAAREIGFTDVRLQFNVGGDETSIEAPVSPRPGVWDTTRFRVFIEPAFAAGMRINANYVIGKPSPHQDAAWHEAAAERFAREFGHMIDSYSFGNEPGADAQAYEEGGPTDTFRDYMRDVYFPVMCLPFVRGIRRAVPNAWILGCDADSADIQKRYTDLADEIERTTGLVVCNEEAVHPYYHVNPALDYASLKGANGKPGFLDVKTPHRPLCISEIDDSDPDQPFAFLEAVVRGDFGPITRWYELFEGAEHRFFEPLRDENGKELYSSFYSPNPIVNESGKRYATLFAGSCGGPEPIKTTMPVGRHRAVKS